MPKEIKRKTKAYKLVPIKGSEIPTIQIRGSRDSAEYARQFYQEDIEIYESIFLICLNRANNTKAYFKVSQGGSCGTVCDITILLKYAIDTLSNAVILVHNHSSGNTLPSEQDKRLTNSLKEALKYFKIPLLDHIILSGTDDKYYSFADEGDL